MATAYAPPIDPPEFDSSRWREQYEQYLSDLRELAKRNGSNELLGELLRWPRGDGYAEYMVWTTKPLALIHVPFFDDWMVEDALIRGLRLADVREMVERSRLWAALSSS